MSGSPLLAEIELGVLDSAFRTVSCRIVREQYVCNLPSLTEDVFCTPTDPLCPCTSCATCSSGRTFGITGLPPAVRCPIGCETECTSDAGCVPGERCDAGSCIPIVSECGSDADCAGRFCVDGACRSCAHEGYHPTLLTQLRSLVRPVRFVPGSRDVTITASGVHVDLSDSGCIIEASIRNAFEPALELAFEVALSEQANAALRALIGERATLDFMVPREELPLCATDEDCWEAPAAPLFGGARHRCADDGTGTSRCALLTFEPRRAYVGPSGFDIVYADGEDDPQRELLLRRFPGVVTSSAAPAMSCHPGRFVAVGALPASSADAAARPGATATGGSGIGFLSGGLGDANLPICRTPPCGANTICAGTGTVCDARITVAGLSVPGCSTSGLPTCPEMTCVSVPPPPDSCPGTPSGTNCCTVDSGGMVCASR